MLDAYGKHVLATFDDADLAKVLVTAVGAVHQDASEVAPGHQHFPKSVPHYWSGYTAEISRKEPHPSSLIQYIRAARAAVRNESDLAPAVERVASGLVRLAGRIGDAVQLKRKARTHRAITDALAANSTVLAAYRRLVKALVIDWLPLTQEYWDSMQDDILGICRALCNGTFLKITQAPFSHGRQILLRRAAVPQFPQPTPVRTSTALRKEVDMSIPERPRSFAVSSTN